MKELHPDLADDADEGMTVLSFYVPEPNRTDATISRSIVSDPNVQFAG